MSKAKNPVMYVGQGVFYADGCAELLQFVELAQILIVTTLKAKSAFPENHALSLGVCGEPVDYLLSNSGFAGYGPGLWGTGQDPHTCTFNIVRSHQPV
jgi:glyoxylate carboligase